MREKEKRYKGCRSAKRSWSAPSAPLQHILGKKVLETSCVASKNGFLISTYRAVKAFNNPRIRIPQFGLLFPAITSCNKKQLHGLPLQKESALTTSTQTSPSPISDNLGNLSSKEAGSSYDALKAQLEAATSQIHLLSSANEQTLRRYIALEEANKRLRDLNETLCIENELLKGQLLLKESEIGQQLDLSCELECQLDKLKEIVLNKKEM